MPLRFDIEAELQKAEENKVKPEKAVSKPPAVSESVDASGKYLNAILCKHLRVKLLYFMELH